MLYKMYSIQKLNQMEDQLKQDLINDIQILNEVAPVSRLKQSLSSIFKDYLLGINPDIMPNDFQVVVNDYYSLQNFIEKLEKKLK